MTDTIPSWAVPGARVVCINKLGWANSSTGKRCPGPAYNETVTITATSFIPSRGVSIMLKEYAEMNLDRGYLVSAFRPTVIQKTQAEDTAMFERIAHGTTIVERLDLLKEKLDA